MPLRAAHSADLHTETTHVVARGMAIMHTSEKNDSSAGTRRIRDCTIANVRVCVCVCVCVCVFVCVNGAQNVHKSTQTGSRTSGTGQNPTIRLERVS